MGRIGTFLLGTVVGGVAVFGSLQYHVLHAESGFHFVPKATVSFGDTYVDIREFTAQDWANNPDLALAVTRSGNQELMQGAAVDAVNASLQRFLTPRQ